MRRSYIDTTVFASVALLMAAIVPSALANADETAAASGGDLTVYRIEMPNGRQSIAEVQELSTDISHPHVTGSGDEPRITMMVWADEDEAASLERAGYDMGHPVFTPDDHEKLLFERQKTIELSEDSRTGVTPRFVSDDGGVPGHSPNAADDVKPTPRDGDLTVLRVNYFDGVANDGPFQSPRDSEYLYVEALAYDLESRAEPMTLEIDLGPGTSVGDGPTLSLQPFGPDPDIPDTAAYIFHKGRFDIGYKPTTARITAANGDTLTLEVQEWLEAEEGNVPGRYKTGFVTHFMDPTELYDRVHELALEYPQISEVIELPERSHGYEGTTAPASVKRGPHPVSALRIGKHRDGSRPGVFIYAGEHGNEWSPPMVAIETAERLLANYDSNGYIRQLVDTTDIIILPVVNPDGMHNSFYRGWIGGRENARNIDLNRNYAAYTHHDDPQYLGGESGGPAPLSEPESRNVAWLAEQHPNMKFSMNMHSCGNFFMWPPGTYARPGRTTPPVPSPGETSLFWDAAERVAGAINAHRDTVVEPQQTGAVIDVLYPAAGNSSDHLWYINDVYAWDFEVGPCSAFRWEQSFDVIMEFSNGLIETVEYASDFGSDAIRPRSEIRRTQTVQDRAEVGFGLSEPADVYYTLDGSRPTWSSARLNGGELSRDRAEHLEVEYGTTINWFSVDMAGNVEQNYDPDGRGQNFQSVVIRESSPAALTARGPS